MRFLVDAQLPPALARELVRAGHDALHVVDVGLRDASDDSIRLFALNEGAVILTKDEDFAAAQRRGAPPVKIVWIRFGNCSRASLLERFVPRLPDIAALLEAGEVLIEVR